MTLLLDTSVLIALERGDAFVEARIKEFVKNHPGPAHISFMTFFEFILGMEELEKNEKNELIKFLWNFSVLHTTNSTAWLLSHLTHKYKKEGNQKSITDLFIAGQALEHDLTLVTRDRDFADIEEIKKIVI